jgi:hypothetical protein
VQTRRYDNFAGIAAIAAGIGGPLYSVAFVFLYLFQLAPDLGLTLASLLLLLGGVLSGAVMVALYQHVRETDVGFSMLALIIALIGAFGGATHGAYDLANQLHPPSPDVLGAANYPNFVDPRGLATFGFAGVGLVLFAWLMSRGKTFPARLAQLGYLAGALNVIIYLARLIILTPSNPIVLAVAGVTGLIINPAFFIWLGLRLRAMAK